MDNIDKNMKSFLDVILFVNFFNFFYYMFNKYF